MSVSIKQPALLVPSKFDWTQCDKNRLILCRYKTSGIAHTIMRVGEESYISFGHAHDNVNSEIKIEHVLNVGWLNGYVEFVRYYDQCDQLVLIGS